MKTSEQAEKMGESAAKKGLMRVSPFYEEREMRNGSRIDRTEELTAAFFKGSDTCLNSSKRN